jgi:predicted permease
MRIFQWLPSSLRQFRHAPVYSGAFVGSLALAVAATCAAFVVVQKAFLEPLPYVDEDRLLTIETTQDNRQMAVSFFVAQDLRESAVFTGVAPYRFAGVTYEAPDAAERLNALEVTRDFYDVLGVKPALGSAEAADGPDGVVVSWSFFERALGSDAAAIGRRITLDGVPRPVLGVMPRDFVPPFSTTADVLLPLDTRALLADTARARRTVTVVARMAPGVSMADVNGFLEVFGAGQRNRFPGVHDRDAWVATALREDLIGQSRPALIGVAAAAALLMVIVWANIAGLASAQAAATRRATAVRRALGATNARLFRETFADSLVLAALGTGAGLWLAYTLTDVAAGYQQQFLGTMSPIAFGPAAASIGGALGLITGLLAAIVPQHTIGTLGASDLLGSARGMAGGSRLTRLRSGLVLVQVAIALVLIVSAGLLVRTVGNLSSIALGFQSEHLTSINLMLPASRYRGRAAEIQFEKDLLPRLRAVHGVTEASASVGFPAAGAMGARVTILDRPGHEALPEITYFSVAPHFFSFLGVPIQQGRDIQEIDDFPAPRVVVINETMARMFWPEGNAIGAKVKIGAGAATDREITIVGIAADVRQNGPTQDVRPTAYGSTLQYSWPRRHFTVKASRPIPDIAADLRAAIASVDPLLAVPVIRPFDDHVSQQTARHRLVMFSLSVFGATATVLCGFGLYAVIALTSQLRRREYAIRVALGAKRTQVWWLVVRQALALAVGGAIAGLAIASWVTGVLQGTLHGVEPTDTATFAVAAAAVVALAVIASMLPAVRAGRINPIETLKAE